MAVKALPEITSEQENWRLVPISNGALTARRDPVEPVPVGTYVAVVFRVTGYDPDCDGSLMARLEAVDRTGQATGWTANHLGMYPDSKVVVDEPADLWALIEGATNGS